ncbi:hypothetical protein F5Y19DRAFT_257603 [Xylariaceae sp. FL1651]|nr:hypothetical protein F5Y19DRAFT_257603 [Xylariaceae sp. FL1651]
MTDADDLASRLPEFRPDLRRLSPPTISVDGRLLWDSMPHETIEFPSSLEPYQAPLTTGRVFHPPDYLDSDESAESSDDVCIDSYDLCSSEQGSDDPSDLNPTNLSLADFELAGDDSCTLSEGFSSESEESLYHDGPLKGVVDGVSCEFDPHGSFNLNTKDPWFPYMRFPYAFRWKCCGLGLQSKGCESRRPRLRGDTPSSVHTGSGPSYDGDSEGDLDSDEDEDEDSSDDVAEYGRRVLPPRAWNPSTLVFGG